jgi:hypothetical protein
MPLFPSPGPSAKRWLRRTLVIVACGLLAATISNEVLLRFGPSRAATFRGKRAFAGPIYRVSYSYDAAGIAPPSDTDSVSYPYFLAAARGTPLRVRTFGWGTFRFARLCGAADARDERTAAARWGGLAALGGVGTIRVSRRRRRRPSANGESVDS